MRKSLQSSEYRQLTSLLVGARNAAGMTQQQVADKLGKPQSFVAKYENGERRLDVIEFITICKTIAIAPEDVIRAIADDVK